MKEYNLLYNYHTNYSDEINNHNTKFITNVLHYDFSYDYWGNYDQYPDELSEPDKDYYHGDDHYTW